LKPGKDVIVILILFVFLVVGSMFLWGGKGANVQEEILPKRTTYSNRPGGVKALYLTLSELGYRVRRYRGTPSRLPPNGVLFLVEPESSIRKNESVALQRWIKEGNFLCAFMESELPESAIEWTGPVDPFQGAAMTTSSALQPSFLARGGRPLLIRSRVRLSVGAPAKPEEEEASASLRRPGSVQDFPPPELIQAEVPIFSDKHGVTLTYSRLGQGGVILCCSPWTVSNQGLAQSRNLDLIINALQAFAPQKERVILFDEYHHGYGERRSLLSLLPPLARLGLLQLVVALMLLLFSVGRRFGAPVTVEEQKRVRGEYLSAMSILLRRAGAVDLAADRLKERFRRDLAAASRLPHNASEQELARAAEASKGVPGERVLRLFSACEQVKTARVPRRKPAEEVVSSAGGRSQERRLLMIAKEIREVMDECRKRK